MKTNTIFVIGFMGGKTCYMNISLEEAITRYCKDNDLTLDEFDETYKDDMEQITFIDEFSAYHISGGIDVS